MQAHSKDTESKGVGSTPGPWQADEMTGPSWCICTDAEGAIADVWTSEQDARLIAAAPEMLEALELISDRDPCNQLDGIDGSCLLHPPCIGCVARAAIAKAKGGR